MVAPASTASPTATVTFAMFATISARTSSATVTSCSTC